MPKPTISLSEKAIRKINEILSGGGEVKITLVGKRLRIARVKSSVEYDVMIAE